MAFIRSTMKQGNRERKLVSSERPPHVQGEAQREKEERDAPRPISLAVRVLTLSVRCGSNACQNEPAGTRMAQRRA